MEKRLEDSDPNARDRFLGDLLDFDGLTAAERWWVFHQTGSRSCATSWTS
jgi:hypothetical protein